MPNNKNPNEKRPGEKPDGTYHFNPGNQSGKTVKIVRRDNDAAVDKSADKSAKDDPNRE